MQTHTLFAAMNNETPSSQRSDFQDEDAKCKIFTCCREVNKLPSLACWDQSKVWAKDMKARDGMLRGWAGRWGGGGIVFIFACARVSTCKDDSAESRHSHTE